MITKDDIIKEIRETAKANGNVPLGRDRFQDQTGIKEYDWGRYWPRFSDAQREAGYSPNLMNSAYDDNYLYEKFIALMRELNKWPTRGDLRVKRNSSKDFPNEKTFQRLGTKQKIASKLLEYAINKNYDDVVEICNSVLKEYEEREESMGGILEDNAIGSVYLIKSGRYYKIGRTNSMGRRHHEITIQLPEGVELIHEIRTDDPSGIEAYWHKRFEAKRKNGEWFDLNSSEVKAFRHWRRIV
ncbi:MAG: GIY-YIG nuclease family protein [Rhabdochlamydiaceae bacterium]